MKATVCPSRDLDQADTKGKAATQREKKQRNKENWNYEGPQSDLYLLSELMDYDLESCPGGINDVEEFLGNRIEKDSLDTNKPLELQGVLDSLDTMQFIIFLEKKYKKRLSNEEISSLNLYSDLLKIFLN